MAVMNISTRLPELTSSSTLNSTPVSPATWNDYTSTATYYTTDNDTNTTNSTYTDWACYTIDGSPAVVASEVFYLWSAVFFVVIGLIGNGMSVLVFSSRGMRLVSSNTYLLVLAISDSLYLISIFCNKILTTMRCLYFASETFDISNRNDTMCKLLQYLVDLFSDYSTCLILAFTVERFIAVYKPLIFKEVCTANRARLSCFLIFLVIAVTVCPYHWISIGRYEEFNVCAVLRAWENLFTGLYVTEFVLYRVFPVFIISVLNVLIIIKVAEVTRNRKVRKSATTTNTCSKTKRTKKEDRSMQLTIILVLVSTSYILAYIPVLVHFILWKLQRLNIISLSSEGMLIAGNYTKSLYISGFAINFFLYTMSGRVFREQLEMILCEARFNSKKDYAHVTTTEAATIV